MKYTLTEAIEIALRTWYPEGHILRDDPHHPLGKLLGEWGELLDDFMKSIYKPGYVFEPQDELGDIWYYTRILIWQLDYTEYDLDNVYFDAPIDTVAVEVMSAISEAFLLFKKGEMLNVDFLAVAYSGLNDVASAYSLELDDLTASNWEKLKPGSERGEEWMKATANSK